MRPPDPQLLDPEELVMPARQPGRRVWGERAYPRLEEDQLARLSEFGVSQKISAGQFIFRLGDDKYDLVVIDKGQLEIIKEAGPGYPEEVIATFGPGEFIGELSILTGQFVYLLLARLRMAASIEFHPAGSARSWRPRQHSPTF